MGPEYEIEMDIKIDARLWSTDIFRFHEKDVRNDDCCDIGQRIPSLRPFEPPSLGELILSTNIDDNGNRGFFINTELKKWYNFKFFQKKDEVEEFVQLYLYFNIKIMF